MGLGRVEGGRHLDRLHALGRRVPVAVAPVTTTEQGKEALGLGHQSNPLFLRRLPRAVSGVSSRGRPCLACPVTIPAAVAYRRPSPGLPRARGPATARAWAA